MTTISSSSKISSAQSRSSEEVRLKKSSSEVTINNDKMCGSLEELMTYIGSSYPHFRKTVAPLALVTGFLFLSSRFLAGMAKVKALKNTTSEGENFYSKCAMNGRDDSLTIGEYADFMPDRVPKWELTVIMNAILMFAFTTVSPRRLAMFSASMISVSYFVMAHFPRQMQMSLFISQFFTEMYRYVAMVTIAESVPKYHRMPALVILEFVKTSFRVMANVLVRLPADIEIDMSYCFEVFGFVTVAMVFVTYYTFNDSLYSLLARSKTDEMQSRVTEIFQKAKISLPPDAVIDQIAFENFENNENPIEIMIRTLKTFKLIQEVVVCSLIAGACMFINAFMETEMVKHSEVMFFERSFLPPVSYTICAVLLMILAVILPKHRVLPIIILIPSLFCVTSLFLTFPIFFQTFDDCTKHTVVKESYFPAYLVVGAVMSALTDMIRFFVRVHLIEVMPVLIRTAVIAIHFFISYSFFGNVREFYSTESYDVSAVLIMITVLSMLVLLITPRKKNYMNVYFSEYTKDDKKRTIPPAPIIEKKVN